MYSSKILGAGNPFVDGGARYVFCRLSAPDVAPLEGDCATKRLTLVVT
jgi:hypothetical protein